MKRWWLCWVVAAAACAALVGAAGSASGQSFGSFGAFVVIPNDTRLAHTTATAFELTLPSETASPARITMYVPAGYTIDLDQPAGTIGDVSAALDAHGTDLNPDGTIVAVDPADYASSSCAPGRHAAVWLLRFVLGSTTIDMPMYVDPTSAADVSLGAYKIEMCFGSTEVPESQGGAPLGARLTDAYLYFPKTFTNPGSADVYAWHVLVTTYIPMTSTINPAVVELRALTYVPASLTIRARYVKSKHTYYVTGVYHAAGRGQAREPVLIFAGKARRAGIMHLVGATQTHSGGKYTARIKSAHGNYFAAYVWPGFSPRCSTPGSAASAGCISESESPTFSRVVKATRTRR